MIFGRESNFAFAKAILKTSQKYHAHGQCTGSEIDSFISMKFYTNSLRGRIFVSMILLMIVTSVLIAGMSIYQSREQARDYHRERLERKEQSIRESINYQLRQTDFVVETENLPLIFREKIYEISHIHEMPIRIFDLKGRLLKQSKFTLSTGQDNRKLDPEIVSALANHPDKRYVEQFAENGENYQSSYTYILDRQQRPLGILHLPYLENDDFMNYELREFLGRLSIIYLLMFVLSILLAYLLSRYITRSLRTVSSNIEAVELSARNEKIDEENAETEEIKKLVKAYNNMVDALEASAVKLAASEREYAWREMAKQVAHEIKNPLTPMRLSVQSFERRFDPQDPDAKSKVKEFCRSMVEQIDTMSNIAAAFSTYASMPAQQKEEINVPKVVHLALEIFHEDNISFHTSDDRLYAVFDRTQMIRVITNLVKNAIQAEKGEGGLMVNVRVTKQNKSIKIAVSDNGRGISEENKAKVFEPKFTTKTSGMGLGLAMVKQIVESFGGTIDLESQMNKGTTIYVSIPHVEK